MAGNKQNKEKHTLNLAKVEVKIGVATEKYIHDKRFSDILFKEILADTLELEPDVLGWRFNAQPFTLEAVRTKWGENKLIAINHETNEETWGLEPVQWYRDAPPAGYGGVSFTAINQKGSLNRGCVNATFDYPSGRDWLGALEHLCQGFSAYFGYVHLVTQSERVGELVIGGPPGRKEEYRISSTAPFPYIGHEGPVLSNLGWATFLDQPFIDEALWAKIAEADYQVERIGSGGIIRLTDQMTDLIDDYPAFSNRRAQLKQMFPPDLFRIKDEPPPLSAR